MLSNQNSNFTTIFDKGICGYFVVVLKMHYIPDFFNLKTKKRNIIITKRPNLSVSSDSDFERGLDAREVALEQVHAQVPTHAEA